MEDKEFLTLDELYNLFKFSLIEDVEKIPQVKRKIENASITLSNNSLIKEIIDDAPILIKTKNGKGVALFNCKFERINGSIQADICMTILLPLDFLKKKTKISKIPQDEKELRSQPINAYLQSGKIIDKKILLSDFIFVTKRKIA